MLLTGKPLCLQRYQFFYKLIMTNELFMNMKKWIAVILVLVVLLIAGVYFFIPVTLTVSNFTVAHCSSSGANRAIIQKENWKKFWQGKVFITPQKTFSHDDVFVYNNDSFRVTKLLQNAVQISISGNGTEAKSLLLFLPLTKDSVQINWSCQMPTSTHLFNRIQQYRQAVQTKKNMTDILRNINLFVSKDENVYGISIQQTSTKDTSLVSTKMTSKTYPSTEQVYMLIEKLQAYVKENQAVQTGYPMMNVTQVSKGNYVLMTAIPVNKLLPETGDITYKRMIPGNFLTATITGGDATVSNAQTQMQQYFQDYNRTAMAIPFQYLVTDRSKETDTSKWVTKMYFPVM